MKKSLLTIILAIALLVTLVLPATAEGTGSLSTTAKLLEDGTSFVVELNVKNNPGIIALEAEVAYDSSVLRLKSAKNGEIFESIFTPSQTLAVNPYKIIWMDATASEDIKTNGVLAVYTFEVLNTAAIGQTEIKFNITDSVNYEKNDTSKFKGCKFAVTVTGSAADGQQSNTSSKANNTGSNADQNELALEVQKPIKDNTASDTVSDKSSSLSADTSSELQDDANEEIDEADPEGKDRTLVTILTIAAVLVVGVGITLVALYFRKKSGDKSE